MNCMTHVTAFVSTLTSTYSLMKSIRLILAIMLKTN